MAAENASTKNESQVHDEVAPASLSPSPINTAIDQIIFSPDLARLKSAYRSLTPNCDDRTKALYRIAPAAREARLFPDMAEDLHRLLRSWASGELWGDEVKGWSTAGSNGLTGEQIFDGLWKRFVTQTGYTGKETTLGSVYHAAKMEGWTYQSSESAE